MRIAKPLLLVLTPLGVAFGLCEAYRLAGGLVVLMAAMVSTLGVAMGSVVMTIRREGAVDAARRVNIAADSSQANPGTQAEPRHP